MLSVRLSYSYERYISGTPPGNFFKFGTNVSSDSRTKWLESGGLVGGGIHLKIRSEGKTWDG